MRQIIRSVLILGVVACGAAAGCGNTDGADDAVAGSPGAGSSGAHSAGSSALAGRAGATSAGAGTGAAAGEPDVPPGDAGSGGEGGSGGDLEAGSGGTSGNAGHGNAGRGGGAGRGGNAGTGGTSGAGGHGGHGGTAGSAGSAGSSGAGGHGGNAGSSGMGGSGGMGGGGGMGGSGGATPCNTTANAAPAVMSTDTNQGVPNFNQGTIKAGTWYLTQVRHYPNAPVHTNGSFKGTLKVTVAGQVVTLDGIENTSTFNLSITMNMPTSNAPIEEKVLCTTGPALFGSVGTITGMLNYEVTNNGNQLDLYLPALKQRRTYTFHP